MLPVTLACPEPLKRCGLKRIPTGRSSPASGSSTSTPSSSFADLQKAHDEEKAASLIQARFRVFLQRKRLRVVGCSKGKGRLDASALASMPASVVGALAFGAALALLPQEAGALSEVPTLGPLQLGSSEWSDSSADLHVDGVAEFDLAQRLEDVAAAQAAAATEAALQVSQKSSRCFGVSASAIEAIEKAALAVLLRYGLVTLLVSTAHVDDLLGSVLGHFGAALTIGTACGVAARAAALPLQAALHAAASAPPRAGPILPPPPLLRRLRRRKSASTVARRTVQAVGGFSRAFAVTSVSTFAFDTLRAAESIASAPDDASLIAAGLAAGGLAAAATMPIDSGISCVRRRIKKALPSEEATRMLLALDISSFCFLEALCAAVGLTDPVDAL